jgi:hypothetical protein
MVQEDKFTVDRGCSRDKLLQIAAVDDPPHLHLEVARAYRLRGAASPPSGAQARTSELLRDGRRMLQEASNISLFSQAHHGFVIESGGCCIRACVL